MSSFTVSGVISGIDYNELIDKLLEIKRQPINILEDKKADYNEKINSYSDLSSKLSTLKSAVDKLKTTSNFYVKDVSVSDSTVLDATVSNSASVGNYTITVTTLASEEKEVHNGTGLTSSSDVINNSGTDKVFQYTYAGTQRTLTVADGTTLEGLKNLINDDSNNPGVIATIVNDGTNYRLIITGRDAGATNTITIDSGTTLDGTDSTVDFTAASFTETKTAADADFTVDGLQIRRSSNSISDVIEGVTFTLKKESSSATISVTADTEEIKDQIISFVNAYNDVVEFISTNSAYDSVTGESGILSGEGTARNIQNKLRDIVTSSVSGLSGELSMLAEIGITTDYETGKLEIDSSELDEKLASNLDDVAELFNDSTNGIAVQIFDYITDVTSAVDGSITLRKEGLQDIIENIEDTIRNMEYRLEKTEDDLIRKFTSLETLVSSFNTIGNFLTNFSITI
jgi:flagellar hook-associated protein 2